MADNNKEIDKLTGTATTGHEWDGIRELNTPLPRWWLWTFYACIVWAVGYWVVYPAWPLLTNSTQGVARLAYAQRGRRPTSTQLKVQRGPMMDKLDHGLAAGHRERSAAARFRPRARQDRRSPITARPAMAPAAAAARAIPTSTTTTGCGAASSPRSSRPSATARARGDDDGHQGSMPAFGRDGILSRRKCRRWPIMCARCPACRPSRAPISARRQETLRRQLRGLSRRERQGQPRAGRAQSHRQDLALRVRQENHHGGPAERSRRRDAGLGWAPERPDHQGADGLCPQLRRRRKMIVRPRHAGHCISLRPRRPRGRPALCAPR